MAKRARSSRAKAAPSCAARVRSAAVRCAACPAMMRKVRTSRSGAMPSVLQTSSNAAWVPGSHSPSTGTVVGAPSRSEEHTSELQSHVNLVCRLLLEKKNALVPQQAAPLQEHDVEIAPSRNAERETR